MQDCNSETGNKKEPSAQLTPKGSIHKLSNKVYHIIKPKGNAAMLELKITVTNATELTKEVTDLYEKVVGEPMAKVYPEAKAGGVKKETKTAKKAEPKADEVPKALQWATSDVKDLSTIEEPKAEAVKEEPKQEELPVDVPSVEEVRAAVKEILDKKGGKKEFKMFLDSIKLDKVSNANGGQLLAIMDWVKSRA
nr:MAG TPA: hypothetical protein [Caudoviricetes sp.]